MKALGLALAVLCACHHQPASPTATIPTPPIPAVEPGPNAMMRVHLIDVGQGAATLIEFSCAAVLVDTGGESNDQFDSTAHLITYLTRFFKHRPHLHDTLALLVLTHPHIDHTRGARAVFDHFHVQNVLTDGLRTSSGGTEQGELIDAASSAKIGNEKIGEHGIPPGGLRDPVIDPVACPDGDPDIRVFWGAVDKGDVDWDDGAINNMNNDSIVIRFALGKASFLINGDLELDGIAALLARFGASGALRSTAYQVDHHGSYNGTTKALVDAIAPKLALIATGPADRHDTWTAYQYGHPRAVAVELLEAGLTGDKRPAKKVPIASHAKEFDTRELTAPIYATGWDGDVHVTLYADGRIHVDTEKK